MIVDWIWVFYEVFECILIWIINEVVEVNCVVLDIISKLFVIIEWE